MGRKIFKVFCILVTISAWFNFLMRLLGYASMVNPASWDAVKLLIDFVVAVGWTLVTVLWCRRKS